MAETVTAVCYTVLGVLVVTVLFRLKLRASSRRDAGLNLPPGPWTLPVIGSMYCLFGALPHHALQRLALRYGPVMLLRLGHVRTLVVSSPEAARDVMKTHDAALANRPVYVTMDIFTYGGQNIALSPYTSAHWKELRRLCTTELLGPRRVQSFRPIREEEAASLVRSVVAAAPLVNVSDKVRLMMNDIIMRAIVGDRSPHREAYLEEMGNALKLLAGFNLVDLFPTSRLARVLGGRSLREARQVHARIDRIVKAIIQSHAKAMEKKVAGGGGNADREDLLEILLRLQKDGGQKTTLSTDVISSTLFELFSAGSETTMTTITWAMSELMRNPRAIERAQAEIRQVLQGKAKVREEDIEGRLHYLQIVIKETLRLHPPVPMLLPRLCAEEGEPCKIMGYDIPPGTTVLVNAWAIGRDDKSWTNATEFRPERFEDGVVEFNGADFRFLPGGAGRRMCPGLMFGVSNIELTLANLLYHFDWKLPNGASSLQLDMSESHGITAHRKTDLWLEATPYVPADANM